MTQDEQCRIATYIETTVRRLCGENSSPQELDQARLELSVQILDSEYMNYSEGELESFLMEYLVEKRLKK